MRMDFGMDFWYFGWILEGFLNRFLDLCDFGFWLKLLAAETSLACDLQGFPDALL